MGHGADGTEAAPAFQVVSTGNGQEEDGSENEDLALLTPFQLGPFKLSHSLSARRCLPPSTNRPLKNGQVHTNSGELVDTSTPRAIETEEVAEFVEQFRIASRNAIEAGFDGVELHAAHGYLMDQFLKDRINDRTDKYGGSVENRSRFMVEVVEAVTKEIGSDRVGIRVSPFTDFQEATDSNPNELALHIAETLNKFDLLCLHVVEPRFQFAGEIQTEHSVWPMRRAFKNSFFAAGGGFSRESGEEAVKSGRADVVVYGRLFLANSDMPKRFALNAPLNKYDRATFYTLDPVAGNTDYPYLENLVESKA